MAGEFSLAILCELQRSSIDQVLNLILQRQTIICIMPRAIRMISTPCLRILVRRGSLRARMRVYHHNQVHPQHVLQCLWQWHVYLGELPLRSFHPWPIFGLMLTKSLLGSRHGRKLGWSPGILSHGRLSNDLISNHDCFPHMVATVLTKLVDKIGRASCRERV